MPCHPRRSSRPSHDPGKLASREVTDRTRGPILKENSFNAELSSEDEHVMLSFRGGMLLGQPEALLIPFLQEVHERLVAIGCQEVQVDFRQLEYLAPAALKAFVHWTAAVRALPRARRYRLIFACAPGMRWQRTSLLALQCSAGDIVVFD